MPRPGERWRRCQAVETPVKPPPTIATSATIRPREPRRGPRRLALRHPDRAVLVDASGHAPAPNPYASGSSRHLDPHGGDPMSLGIRVRLCLKDLYAQDVVEMIERETRKYEVESIEHPVAPRLQARLPDPLGRLRRRRRDGARAGDPQDDARRLRPSPLPSGTLRPLLPAGRARPRDRHDPRRPRRPRAGEPGLRPGPLPRLPVAHLHAARGARHRAHLLAADRAARPRRQLPAHPAPARAGSRCRRPTRRGATSACGSISRPRSSTSARRTSSRCSASCSTAAVASTRSIPDTSPTGSRTSATPS